MSSPSPLSIQSRCCLWPAKMESANELPFDDYRRQSRGGKGIITMRTGEKTGDVVGALTVRETDEIMLITNKGQMVRTRVKEIRETGRNTDGRKTNGPSQRRKASGNRTRSESDRGRGSSRRKPACRKILATKFEGRRAAPPGRSSRAFLAQ